MSMKRSFEEAINNDFKREMYEYIQNKLTTKYRRHMVDFVVNNYKSSMFIPIFRNEERSVFTEIIADFQEKCKTLIIDSMRAYGVSENRLLALWSDMVYDMELLDYVPTEIASLDSEIKRIKIKAHANGKPKAAKAQEAQQILRHGSLADYTAALLSLAAILVGALVPAPVAVKCLVIALGSTGLVLKTRSIIAGKVVNVQLPLNDDRAQWENANSKAAIAEFENEFNALVRSRTDGAIENSCCKNIDILQKWTDKIAESAIEKVRNE